jgi:hypothetical protein
LDAVITKACQDVPIPAGLEQRLLVALEDSSAASPGVTSMPDGEQAIFADHDLEARSTDSPSMAGVSPRRKSTDPSWLRWTTVASWSVVASCAAAFVLIPVLANWRSGGEVSTNELEASALSWELDDDGWILGKEMWTKHPLPDDMFTKGVKRRQMFRLPRYGAQAACYDLNMSPGASARVFVFAEPSGFTLSPAPTRDPMFTRGTCVSAWSSGGFAYVLVLNGGEDDYRSLIQRRSQFAAWSPLVANLYPIRTA